MDPAVSPTKRLQVYLTQEMIDTIHSMEGSYGEVIEREMRRSRNVKDAARKLGIVFRDRRTPGAPLENQNARKRN